MRVQQSKQAPCPTPALAGFCRRPICPTFPQQNDIGAHLGTSSITKCTPVTSVPVQLKGTLLFVLTQLRGGRRVGAGRGRPLEWLLSKLARTDNCARSSKPRNSLSAVAGVNLGPQPCTPGGRGWTVIALPLSRLHLPARPFRQLLTRAGPLGGAARRHLQQSGHCS